jgi:5'-AMP-activated protein kinase catalytic alpha subunit
MISGKRYNGLSVDIWSSGVVLYAMICGYLPFENPDTSELYKTIIKADYDLPKWVSKSAESFLTKILNPDPNTRATIEDIKSHPWYNQMKQLALPNQYKVTNKGSIAAMEELGFNSVYVQNCINDNKHNHVTTTYFLLTKNIQVKNSKKDKIQQLLTAMNNGTFGWFL